ncbi:MAG: M23 family metallopeptidase [Vulcanococcus sp.]
MPVALLVPALQLLHPMPGVVTQDVRTGHPAIDIACIVGTPVHAAHDGIARVERSYTHGTTVVLVGDLGLETSYSHLNSAQPAGRYSRGDLIGTCGNTGIWSSGPHLHFESNRPELLSTLATPELPTNLPVALPVAAVGGSPLLKAKP